MNAQAIFIDKAGQGVRQHRPAHVKVALPLLFQTGHHALHILGDQRGIGTDRGQGPRRDPLGLRAPGLRKLMQVRRPLRIVLLPVAHDLVQASAIDAAGRAADLLDEVAKQDVVGPELLVIDIAVQRDVHSVHKSGHAAVSSQALRGCRTGRRSGQAGA